jgi:molybdopterin synthase catalytic subunit
MIEVTVRFFAGHRDIVGQAEKTMSVAPGTTAHQLWEKLVADHPPLQPYGSSVRVAINQEFCAFTTVLSDGDEVAYIPPVSGGSEDDFVPFAVTHEELNPLPLMQWVQSPADGAVVTFAGVVRDNLDGRSTVCLTYEVYADMAVSALARIADDARTRWHTGRIAVHHRVGEKLAVGTTVVLVVVAAPHRADAFAAVAYVMERVKQEVPMWKREHWADGNETWHHDV